KVQARTAELAQSVSELRALGDVSQAVNSTLDLGNVLTTIVTKAVQLSNTEAGAIYVFDEQQQEFQLRATHGMDHALIEELRKQKIGPDNPRIASGIRHNTPIETADIRQESQRQSTPSSCAPDIGLFSPSPYRGRVRSWAYWSFAAGSPDRFQKERWISSKPLPPNRCWPSRTRVCSVKSTRKAVS